MVQPELDINRIQALELYPAKAAQARVGTASRRIRQWLAETYTGIVARAKAEGGVIYWGDETAVKEDANWVRSYAPRGKTPVLKTPTR